MHTWIRESDTTDEGGLHLDAEVNANDMTKQRNLKKIMMRIKGFPVIPVSIISLVVLCAIFAPFIAPHEPHLGNLRNVVSPTVWQEGGSTKYLLGTDHMGRDVFSRLIYGSRISLLVAVIVIILGALLGTALGLASAFFGRWVDAIIMRITDTFLAMPYILMALVMAAVLGPSLQNVIIVLSIVTWAQYCRMVRGEALSIREMDFVAMARIYGCNPVRIMLRHIFPNVVNTLIVLATLNVGVVILFEAILSFLGVGVPPPTPSWGRMVADGRNYIASHWWLAAVPGLAIMMLVLSMNLLGDWLRDTFDPKRRQL
jgi:peptide/nickel transport system permease protein